MENNEKHKTPKGVVNFWTEFVDWKKREMGYNNFFINKLKEYKCKKILDTCLGDGFDSINLIENGFQVFSNEIDNNFKNMAIKNAKERMIKLEVSSCDWRELSKYYTDQFDGLICLGNSLTYLLKKEDQLKALEEMFKIIKNGGILIIDQRNYDYILDKREKILNGEFNYSKKYYYCSDKISGYPIEINNDYIIIGYGYNNKKIEQSLKLYPFRVEELRLLLKKVGFKKVETYYDFKKEKPEHFDFVQHIAVK